MKKYTAVFMSILLLTFGFSMNADETFAVTPMQEKENILEDLQQIKNDSEINKKTKKSLEKAIKEIKKSLESKLWEDESTLNIKDGKKVFDAEKKAVKELEQIIKDKKESEQIKNNIIEILEKLVNIDKVLAETAINDAIDSVGDEKTFKKLEKAQKTFEKGNLEFVNGNFQKAIKHFGDAWNKIQKALKEPHAKKMKKVNETDEIWTRDTSQPPDGIADVYLKIDHPKKLNKAIKVDIKIKDTCVNGITHDDAAMKIAFIVPGFIRNSGLTDEGFDVTNKWFKKNDENKQIDRVTELDPFSLPPTGDDMIQKNQEDNKSSFDYNGLGIEEIGDQTGWEGSIEIRGNPGEYEIVLIVPPGAPTSEGDDCMFLSAVSAPITINS